MIKRYPPASMLQDGLCAAKVVNKNAAVRMQSMVSGQKQTREKRNNIAQITDVVNALARKKEELGNCWITTEKWILSTNGFL